MYDASDNFLIPRIIQSFHECTQNELSSQITQELAFVVTAAPTFDFPQPQKFY